jgi:CDP-diacylglycerol---glycerol-3-phosphate 3-phosphatidyltransferase
MLNVPNLISGFRLVIVPVLLCLAWIGEHTLFLIFLTYSLLSDLVDGFIARKLNQASELGAKLDSWSDFVTNMTVPICAWRLWPDLIRQEAPFVITMVVSYGSAAVFGFSKYGWLTSYRTWGSKLSAAFIGGAALILIAGGPTWPFRLSTPVLVLAELEKIAITAILPEWQSNVPSLWHAIKLARRLNHLKHGNGKLEYKDL